MSVCKVHIDLKSPVHVRCECTHEGIVQDLEAAVHWAFLEALRHGPGCNLDIVVDLTLHIDTTHAAGLPSGPT